MSTRSWHMPAAVLLLALLAVVAVLQYRWVGEVSGAERERLRASVRARAVELTTAADRELTQAFAAFRLDTTRFASEPDSTVRRALERVASESRFGTAVREVFVAEPSSGAIQRFDVPTGKLVAAEWPAELAAVRVRLSASPPLAFPGVPVSPAFLADAVDVAAPALVVPMARIRALGVPDPGEAIVMRSLTAAPPSRVAIVWLDRERLRTDVVAPLVERVFGSASSSEFDVAIVERASRTLVFGSRSVAASARSADLAEDFFTLRLEDLHWAVQAPPLAGNGEAARGGNRLSITILRGRSGDGMLRRVEGPGKPWTLLVRAKLGSLDAVVARSRMRNLVLSLGALALLGASMGLLLLSSARAQRTARQQIEFVASVSHELRTPLAVVRSAGENLADGLVSGDQVAGYGALIRDEGRRLTAMVDRVMDFAGMTAGPAIGPRRSISVPALARTVAAACEVDARERDIAVHVSGRADVPDVPADSAALTSALQNVVANAVKYSRPGGTVDIRVDSAGDLLRVTVRDTGLGIDDDDLPHVFEPFYRGRRAVESRVRGSGVGLSVVKKIVEAHGGTVRIANRQGGGVELTIDLPAAADGGEAQA